MYQIRLIAPNGSDAFLTRELVAFVGLFFNSAETVVSISGYESTKHKGHTLTYIDINPRKERTKGHG